MFNHNLLLDILGKTVVVVPALLVAALGLPTLVGRPLAEHVTSRLVQIAMTLGLLAACGVLALMLATGSRHVAIEMGQWVRIEPDQDGSAAAHVQSHAEADSHFHFAFKFVFDRLSVPFAILTFLLCCVIGAFASKYLHREPGFNRFFVLYALFALGMVLASLAGTIETLFTGWELVGLSSALLVAFFHERPATVRNGLRVWVVYRLSDAGLLLAAIVLHHLRGAGDFDALLGATPPWPDGVAALDPTQALFVGGLILIAAAGKSALVPFSGWLPRAMEGPTPSSAIFYGALSVHLGAFLLLRVCPILERSVWLSGAVVVLGLTTAIFAAISARVQTDVKSALSFASLTQVGLIVAEIGLGLRYVALVHILGHACLRTLQFVRASSILQDYRAMEDAIGSPLARRTPGRTWRAALWESRLYRLAIDRGYFDTLLSDYVAAPMLRIFRTCDSLERQWTSLLAGRHSGQAEDSAAAPASPKGTT